MNQSTGGGDTAATARSARVLGETAELDGDLRRRIVALATSETDDVEQFRSSGPIVAELAIWIGVAMLVFAAVRLWA